jgi:predicted RND superfamily exporter protein
MGYFSFTNLETIFEFTDFLPEDDPVVQTLDLLTEEFGGGFGETTSVLIEGDNLATPDVHNALIESINNLSDKENIVVYAGNVAAESCNWHSRTATSSSRSSSWCTTSDA